MSSAPQLSAPLLCPTFSGEAAKIWNNLQGAYSLGLEHKEETVTEHFLLAVQKAHPAEVVTFQFRKPEEKHTGADWEWWLTDGRLWLGLLIQAKRLDPKSHKYEGLKHNVGKAKVPQIDILIAQAGQKGIDPLYFFYNYSPNGIAAFSWTCGSSAPDLLQLGCTVAHAVAVKSEFQQGGAGLPKMSAISLPLKCIVCCPVLADPDDSLPGRANGVVKRLRPGAQAASDGEETQGPGPRTNPPAYVWRLLNSSPDERPRVIEELRQELGPIGTLVVIKERRERKLS